MNIWNGAAEFLADADMPFPEAGVPWPTILTDERGFVLTYWVSDRSGGAIEWDDKEFALVICSTCLALTFGPPNDEALRGHRLSKLGLQAYQGHEVMNSAWIASLEEANRVHASHLPESFKRYRHFVITFHDSTLEFVTQDFTWTRQPGNPSKAAFLAFEGLK